MKEARNTIFGPSADSSAAKAALHRSSAANIAPEIVLIFPLSTTGRMEKALRRGFRRRADDGFKSGSLARGLPLAAVGLDPRRRHVAAEDAAQGLRVEQDHLVHVDEDEAHGQYGEPVVKHVDELLVGGAHVVVVV